MADALKHRSSSRPPSCGTVPASVPNRWRPFPRAPHTLKQNCRPGVSQGPGSGLGRQLPSPRLPGK